MYCFARRDLPDGPGNNGEYWLINSYIRSVEDSQHIVFFDIGCNKGEWTDNVLLSADGVHLTFEIHAFEPSLDSYQYLNKKYSSSGVVINQKALSDKNEDADLYIKGAICAVNSLYGTGCDESITVSTIRFDDYIEKNKISSIGFVKTDTEGADFCVMLGAERALTDGLVEIWQFEYNHRWIYAGNFLKDVFDFILKKPYVLAKLYKNGIEIISEWHPEIERYFEANYILIRTDSHLLKRCPVRSSFSAANVLVKK